MDHVIGVLRACVYDSTLNEKLSDDIPFMDSGMDSLSAVEFGTKIRERFPSANFPNTILFDYPSIRDLAAELMH